MKSLEEALAGAVSAALASVRPEPGSSAEIALVRSHSEVVSSAFLLSVSTFLSNVRDYIVRPPCNHFNDFPCGNNKRTVTSLPAAFRLLSSRRGEQLCAPVRRKVRHAALSPGSFLGISPSIPVPGASVGRGHGCSHPQFGLSRHCRDVWGGGRTLHRGAVRGGSPLPGALSSQQTPLGFVEVGLDHSCCAKLDLAGDPCIPGPSIPHPGRCLSSPRRFPRRKTSSTNPNQDLHSQAVQAQTP